MKKEREKIAETLRISEGFSIKLSLLRTPFPIPKSIQKLFGLFGFTYYIRIQLNFYLGDKRTARR